MKKESLKVYRCVRTGTPLNAESSSMQGDEIVEGKLWNDGHSYAVNNGMPIFVKTNELGGTASFARKYYASIAQTYDENVHVTFELYHEKELDIRNSMISLLNLKADSKVLELSAGTGKDSEIIIQQLGPAGELWLLDISPDMLDKARKKIEEYVAKTEAAVGDACNLPYVDNYFDALYCFAGVGHFTDKGKALKEMARVVRPGGRVVFCEKNVPPWLLNTEYGKILINNNPMFADENPLRLIPVEGRNVGIRWILGNAHYVVDYTVGEGEPVGNFDLILPGHRGGSFKTRYFGKLEGVSDEVKILYEQAATKSGASLQQWLEAAIREKAEKD